MKICIIYFSETGNTRHVAQHLASACDGKILEITEQLPHVGFFRFIRRCYWALREKKIDIEPAIIDVTEYTLLVFGTPVWASRPTPAIHAAINILRGCKGKKAIVFSTHGGRPGKIDQTITRWIEARGMKVAGTMDIHKNDIENEKITLELVSLIQRNAKSQ